MQARYSGNDHGAQLLDSISCGDLGLAAMLIELRVRFAKTRSTKTLNPKPQTLNLLNPKP